MRGRGPREDRIVIGSDAQFARAVHERLLNTLHLIALGQADGALIDSTLAWLSENGQDSVPLIDEAGLADLIGQAVLRSGVNDVIVQDTPAETTAAGVDPRVAAAVTDAVVEALRNAQRHAEATRIIIRFGYRQGSAWIEVRDDGRGFEDGATPRLGLTLAIERGMSEIGGTAEVSSRPGVGTTVLLGLPLQVSPPRRLSDSDRMADQWPAVSRGCRQLLWRLARGDLAVTSPEAGEVARIEDGRIRAWLECRRVDSWLADQAYRCVSEAADRGEPIRLVIAGDVGIGTPLDVDLKPFLASARAFAISVQVDAEDLHALADPSDQVKETSTAEDRTMCDTSGLPEELSVEEQSGPDDQVYVRISRRRHTSDRAAHVAE